MPSLPVIQQLRRDAISRKVAFRALEPDLIMEDAAQVGRLPRGRSGWRGKGSGLPVPSTHICDGVKPGDTVLDLGCGSANQLGWA